jgi:hypothetical protein
VRRSANPYVTLPICSVKISEILRAVKSFGYSKRLVLSGSIILLQAASPFICSANAASNSADNNNGLEVTIKSSSGKQRFPEPHNGLIDRVGLRPGQVVEIKLKFRGKKTGESIFLTALDGGTLAGHDGLAADSGGNAKFDYQAASLPGRYRVLLAVGEEDYWFDFYVLDLENPQNNPPRVRVTD